MSTQYDDIQGPYDYIRTKSIALIEHENVRDTIGPYIKGARVLELACGSAFYTYSFLDWGATSVTGVDISSGMIEEAKRNAPNDGSSKGKVDFILADCSKPKEFEGGPFDVVFGAWLLNYAEDKKGLVNMFRNIEVNLKPGGHLVSVTVPPAEDPTESIKKEYEARPPPEGSGGLWYWVLKDVEGGVYFHVHGTSPMGDVAFDCYHLRESLQREAAMEAGLKVVEWGVTSVPERYLQGRGEGGASLKELESYKDIPNYGLLVVEKEK
ncbi:uncharacterized protein KY384_001601 [Bacidia gigantensis]|uniref:uncharacterized protein n=1 Tax=Bacidia gigantensis TaxID=2732470 RepID=UPI001D042E04|nr:uncharacterized protein KY384_001601 [Bacidia gigantensis]KAG8533860.1 hypothetical protein KY384_001601 [Bacidia gigantensis]